MFREDDAFLMASDKKRIVLQTMWEKLFYGEYIHRVITNFKTGEKTDVDPLVPLPSTISETMSDLLFGEFPIFEWETDTEQKSWEEFIGQYDFETDMLESNSYVSGVGTLFWKLWKTEDGKIEYQFMPATKTIYRESFKALTDVIFFEEQENKFKDHIKTFLIEEHTLNDAGKYQIETYEIRVDMTMNKVKKVSDIELDTTELDFIPIIKMINLGQINSDFGKSDYQGKEQLFAEVDNRFDQNNHILNENAEPWTFVPPGVLNSKGNFKKRNGKMVEKIPKNDAANTVDIVEWSGNMAASFDQIEKMTDMIFFTGRMSAAIVGLDKGGQVDSGRALKWKSINTFAMINRKRRYAEKAIDSFITMSNKIDPKLNLETKNLNIMWKDGIPMDSTQQIDDNIKRVDSKTLSHVTAIERMDETTENEAQKEFDKVKSEQGEAADLQSRSLTIGL